MPTVEEKPDQTSVAKSDVASSVWQPMKTAPRPSEDDPAPIYILQNGRRFIAVWDDRSGHFFAEVALDGPDPHNEFPGRLYGAEAWAPLIPPPLPEVR